MKVSKPQNSKATAKAQIGKKIELEESKFRMTTQYLKLIEREYTDQKQLDRANAWVKANIKDLDPSKMYVCTTCDDGADFNICGCHLKIVTTQTVVDDNAVFRSRHWQKPLGNLTNDVYNIMGWDKPSFYPEQPYNRKISGFENKHIHPDFIIPKLYSYVSVNMNTCYPNSYGFEDRDLRLEHCRRLALRYAELHSLDVTDLLVANRIKHTVQRVCDQQENAMLYERDEINQSFWKAWLPRTPLGWLILFLLCVLATLLVRCAILWLGGWVATLENLSDLLVLLVVLVLSSPIAPYLPNGSMQMLLQLMTTRNVVAVVVTFAILLKFMRLLRGSGHSKRR